MKKIVFSDEQCEDIARRYSAGDSVETIASLNHCSPHRIRKELLEIGICLRAKGWNGKTAQNKAIPSTTYKPRELGANFPCGHPRVPQNWVGKNKQCKQCQLIRKNRKLGIGIDGAAEWRYDSTKLAALRERAGLTQWQIADALGVKLDMVREWEHGVTPSAPNILGYLIACKARPIEACTRKIRV